MNWTRLKFWKRGSPFTSASGASVPLAINGRQEIRLVAPDPAGKVTPFSTAKETRGTAPMAGKPAVLGWFGWLTGRNRRRENAKRLVQGELLLRQVRPLRNDFRDEPGDAAGRKNPKVLYETPPSPERRDDQDHAWNRLRNRRTATVVSPGE